MSLRIAFVVNALSGKELKSGENDARCIHRLLMDPALGGCDASSPTPIVGCPDRHQFEKALVECLGTWDRGNQLVFYYSGHGQVLNGKYSLVFGGESTTYLPFDSLMADLEMHGVGKAILIVDACHSGATLAGQKGSPRSAPRITAELPQGIGLLASCREFESSYELEDGSSSVFTHLVVEGVESGLQGRPTSDALIGLEDIVEYVNDRMTSPEFSSFPQSPAYGIHDADRKLWLAKNRSGSNEEHSSRPAETAATLDELRFLYEITADSRRPCPGPTPDELDWKLVMAYARAADSEIPADSTREEVCRLLGFYSAVSPQALDRASVMCFAKHPEKFIPQARAVFVAGSTSDRVYRRVDVLGPLSYQVSKVIDLVEEYISEHGAGGVRAKESELFLRVIREATSNAIAHRSYNLTGTVRVTARYPFVEITNPGQFPDGRSWEELLESEHVSSPTDAAVAWYMTALLGFEGVGRGFQMFSDYLSIAGSEFLVCDEIATGPSVQLTIRRRRFRDQREPVERAEQTITAAEIGGRIDPNITAAELVRRTDESDVAISASDTDDILSTLEGRPIFKGPLRQIGHYEIIQEIGRGGMGVVYSARDPELQRNVAIKILPGRYEAGRSRERFKREARASARLSHPGIVRVIAIGEEADYLYFVMELVEGGTLQELIDTAREAPSFEARYFHECAQMISLVADALHYAHEHGVIHRDVKPSNILIDEEGRPHLSDFGLAKDLGEITLSVTGELAGTPRYMSPEQVMAKRSGLDHRTDVFSLGLILYELITRQLPFEGETLQELFSSVAFAEVVPPRQLVSRIPRDLEMICLKAIERRPAQRYQSAGEFADDLRRFLDVRPVRARPIRFGILGRLRRRLRRWLG